mgnify:CR=1 FL=1
MRKIDKFFWINGLLGALLFYYFVRKIQISNSVDPSVDPFGLMGAAYYGLGLGFIFGIKFIDLKKIIAFLKRKN